MQANLTGDIRYAFRTLRKSPVFVLVAVSSLALGIGVNTTIFTVVNSVLLRPLPVSRPDELVEIYTSESGGNAHSTTSYPDYVDFRDQNQVFSDLVGHSLMFATMGREGTSQLVMGEVVTGNYFDALGIKPALGRGFLAEEDTVPGAHPVAVIGHGFWQRQFGGAPDVLGKAVRIRGLNFTIVGVAPERSAGWYRVLPDLWIPAMMVGEVEPAGIFDAVPSPTGSTTLDRRGTRWMFVKGRLKPGVTLARAQADLDAVMAQLQQENPQTNTGRKVSVLKASDVRLHPLIDNALAPVALILMAVVGLVLLVACANIASMLLARATTRARETAIRLAIGASRGQIVRQLLIESLVLSAVGGGVGLLAARWITTALVGFQPPMPIRISLDLRLDWRVLVFTLAVSLLTGVLFGLAPALQASRPDLVQSLKEGAPGLGYARRRVSLRDALVVGQVAISLVLLVGAGLFVRSLSAARGTDVGFNPRGLVISTVDLGMSRYTPERGKLFSQQALERIRALPGVEAAAATTRHPFSINFNNAQVFIEGRPAKAGDLGETIDTTTVDAGYFKTLGVPLLQGRDFGPSDLETSPLVAVVNETMARRYWPAESAMGRRFRTQGIGGPLFEVVGVCRDYNSRTVGEGPRPYIHFARSAAVLPVLHPARPDPREREPHAGGCPPRPAGDGAQSGLLSEHDDGGRGGRDAVPGACRHGPDWHAGSSGDVPGRSRPLRAHRLLGQPEHAGDRSANGAGRAAGHRGSGSHRPRHAVGGGRAGRRVRACRSHDPVPVEHALRCRRA